MKGNIVSQEAASPESVTLSPCHPVTFSLSHTTAPVTENVALARDTYRVRFQAPELARAIRPGSDSPTSPSASIDRPQAARADKPACQRKTRQAYRRGCTFDLVHVTGNAYDQACRIGRTPVGGGERACCRQAQVARRRFGTFNRYQAAGITGSHRLENPHRRVGSEACEEDCRLHLRGRRDIAIIDAAQPRALDYKRQKIARIDTGAHPRKRRGYPLHRP